MVFLRILCYLLRMRFFERHTRFCAILTGFLGLVLASQVNALSLSEPLPREGATLTYDIEYQGDVVGRHSIRIEHFGDAIAITHNRKIEVDVLFVKAFSEEHSSREIWTKNAELQSVKGYSITNGNRLSIDGERRGDTFEVTFGGQKESIPMPVATDDSYWVTTSVKQPRVISVARSKTLIYTSKNQTKRSSSLSADGMEIALEFDGDFLKNAQITQDGKTIYYRRVT